MEKVWTRSRSILVATLTRLASVATQESWSAFWLVTIFSFSFGYVLVPKQTYSDGERVECLGVKYGNSKNKYVSKIIERFVQRKSELICVSMIMILVFMEVMKRKMQETRSWLI